MFIWLVFLICTVLIFFFLGFQSLWYWGFFFFFFPYITIVVNLYGTAHGKKKMFLVFVFTAYTNIYFLLLLLLFCSKKYLFIFWLKKIFIYLFLLWVFVFTGVFNLYSIRFFFSYIIIVINL